MLPCTVLRKVQVIQRKLDYILFNLCVSTVICVEVSSGTRENLKSCQILFHRYSVTSCYDKESFKKIQIPESSGELSLML